MIEDKGGPVAAYLALVMIVCSWPFLLMIRPRTETRAVLSSGMLATVLLAASIALTIARGTVSLRSPLIFGLAFLPPLFGLGLPTVLGGLAALGLFATVTWWDPWFQLSAARAGAFLLIGIIGAAMPRFLANGTAGLPSAPVFGVVAVLGLVACMATGVFAAQPAFLMLWHHWGAFVSPVELLLDGQVPYRDFPIQYGMGPTLLIAALSGGDGWRGTYFATALSNMLYLLALVGSTLILTRDFSRGSALLAVSAMTVAVLFWTGYPIDFNGWLVTPSVAGLRFLPLALLVLQILWSETHTRRSNLPGHAIWFLSIAWSPEAAFYATVVWWPYLTVRRASELIGIAPLVRCILLGAGQGLFALIVGVAGLGCLFRLCVGEWPSISGYLTYVRSPPGLLEPNYLGPLWLVIASIGFALLGMLRADRDSLPVRFACLAALVAVGSYYLGRSHDNNLLNLFPFLIIAQLSSLRPGVLPVVKGFTLTVFASLMAWVACFGNYSWTEAWRGGNVATLGPAQLLHDMRVDPPGKEARLASGHATRMPSTVSDAAPAVAWLRAHDAGPPLFINPFSLLIRGMPGQPWTGMDNLANYALLPAPVIREFIRRGAMDINRPGWILTQPTDAGPWLDYFREFYTIAEEHAFGSYVAYRVVPSR